VGDSEGERRDIRAGVRREDSGLLVAVEMTFASDEPDLRWRAEARSKPLKFFAIARSVAHFFNPSRHSTDSRDQKFLKKFMRSEVYTDRPPSMLEFLPDHLGAAPSGCGPNQPFAMCLGSEQPGCIHCHASRGSRMNVVLPP
jgi:hypothetical protein